MKHSEGEVLTGACRGCGGQIGARNKSGMCRACCTNKLSSDPEFRSRVSRGIRQSLAHDPAKLNERRQRMLAVRSTPEAKEGRKRSALASQIWLKGNAAQPAGSPSRMKAGARGSATKLAWCPPELRADYHFLTQRKRLKAAEARKMIEDQHEMSMARWRRKNGIVEAQEVIEPARSFVSDDPLERAIIMAAQVFQTKRDEIMGDVWRKAWMPARYAVALAMSRNGVSSSSIAAAFNRNDHSTALNLIYKGEAMEAADPAFARRLAHVVAAWASVGVAA